MTHRLNYFLEKSAINLILRLLIFKNPFRSFYNQKDKKVLFLKPKSISVVIFLPLWFLSHLQWNLF